MEASRNGQEKKKTVIKFGGGSGGGIGAVVLLGGALATAAFASAFVVGIKGRSSTKDRRSPPPENSNEATKEHEINSTNHRPSEVFEQLSEGDIKEFVSENDSTEGFLVCSRSSLMDGDKIEINGGTQGYVEASDEIISSISPVNDDGFVIVNKDFPLLEEKLKLVSQNEVPEDDNAMVELTREDVSIDNSKEGTTLIEEEEEAKKETNNGGGEIEMMSCKEGVEEEKDVDSVQIDLTEGEERDGDERESTKVNIEKEEVKGDYIGDGEISEEKKCVEAIEGGYKLDLSEDGGNEEAFKVDSEHHNVEKEEKEKALLQEFEGVVIKHEKVEGDEKESAFASEDVVIVQVDEAIQESREDETKYIEEKLVEDEEEKSEQLSDLIEEKEEIIVIGYENSEEKEKALLPEFESVIIEHEKVEGDEKESVFASDAVEIVQEDEGIEESREVEEKLVKEEEEECENIVVPYEINEENVEEVINEDTKVVDALGNDEKEIEQEIVSAKDVEITKENNEENVEELIHEDTNVTAAVRNGEEEIEQVIISTEDVEYTKDEEVHEKNTANIEAAIDDIINKDESTEESENKSDEEEEDGVITSESSDDIVETETSDTSTESNSEAVWPAESPTVKIVDSVVERKILEDETVNGESYFASEKKYGVDMGVVKEYPAKRRMVIGMLSVLSSLSCSWFFGLSFIKLCLVLFLTMVVSEIHGTKLLKNL